jgi:mannose-6-phosphate isomerase-like protein (cupin superfamily)
VCSSLLAQNTALINELEPPKDFENIFVKQVSNDSLQTSFVIWVKHGVKNHFHAEHTENIYVLSGKAEMTLGEESFIVRKGDFITIPMGVHHSVTKVFGRKPLKVLSIQSPRFTGVDRVFVD